MKTKIINPARRWSRYSLRFLLLGVAIFCLGLGVVLHSAREQQRSVESVQQVYGRVMYDYHHTSNATFDVDARSPWPAWLTSGVGLHIWHSVLFVELDSERVTDETVSLLDGLRAMQVLHLSNTSISDEGLAGLRRFPSLRVLTINTEGITDDALRHLGDLPELKELRIYGADVTDVGLAHLENVRTLRRLELAGTEVSPTGVARLQSAIPDCQIDSY